MIKGNWCHASVLGRQRSWAWTMASGKHGTQWQPSTVNQILLLCPYVNTTSISWPSEFPIAPVCPCPCSNVWVFSVFFLRGFRSPIRKTNPFILEIKLKIIISSCRHLSSHTSLGSRDLSSVMSFFQFWHNLKEKNSVFFCFNFCLFPNIFLVMKARIFHFKGILNIFFSRMENKNVFLFLTRM